MSFKKQKRRIYHLTYPSVKRVLDIVFATVLLFFLFIPMSFIWFLIIFTSRGGGIFRQIRVGRDKKNFVCYKFRTMYKDAPICSANQMAKSGGINKYVTPIGKFLRRTSLDELPQLWNVIKGDMSIVGPRPLIIDEKEVHAARDISGVYGVRPGITGLSQIHGRNFIKDSEKVKMDAQYINNISFMQDIKILFGTIFNVALQRGIEAEDDINST